MGGTPDSSSLNIMIRSRANSQFSHGAGGLERRHSKASGIQCTVALLDGRELQLEINVSNKIMIKITKGINIS